MMRTHTGIGADIVEMNRYAGNGAFSRMSQTLSRASGRMRSLRERVALLLAAPEEGAATAEYAVVLVAATGFAGLLVALLKSDIVRTLLTNIVKQALNV